MLLEKEARSSVVEHCFDVARVSGSIPLAPTRHREKLVGIVLLYNYE